MYFYEFKLWFYQIGFINKCGSANNFHNTFTWHYKWLLAPFPLLLSFKYIHVFLALTWITRSSPKHVNYEIVFLNHKFNFNWFIIIIYQNYGGRHLIWKNWDIEYIVSIFYSYISPRVSTLYKFLCPPLIKPYQLWGVGIQMSKIQYCGEQNMVCCFLSTL